MMDNTIKTKAILAFRKLFPYLWKAGAVLLVFLLIGLVIFSFKKDDLLQKVLTKTKQKLQHDFGLDLGYQASGFKGFRTIWIQNIQLDGRSEWAREKQLPVLLQLEQIDVKVSVWALLKGDIALSAIKMQGLYFHGYQKDSVTNYDRFLEKALKRHSAAFSDSTMAASSSAESQKAFTDQFEWVWKKFQQFLPSDVRADDLKLMFSSDSSLQTFDLPAFHIVNGGISGLVRLDGEDAWRLHGELKLHRNQAFLEVVSLREEIEIPYLKKSWNFGFSFDSLLFRLDNVRFSKGNPINLITSSRVVGLQIHQPRLSGEPIQVRQATMKGNWKIGADFLALDEGSLIQLQSTRLLPQIRFQRKPSLQYSLGLEVPLVPAQDFFDDLPRGLFTSIEGIRAKGKLGFKMSAFLDEANLDSIRFDAEMIQEDFRVNSWGNANPSLMNTSFLHEPYEENFQPPAFRVGPENPDFVPLSSISPFLKHAILTTEDPSFFNHRGFIMESIRESIAVNYREKAFVRGASTISMQLIKNVFLHRNKTVVRKVEEMFLVWLMENPRIVSKERQYEVYLNIIEFGNGIYGIKSGARHYFAKHPADLTLGESLFLASIVPKPKRGMYYFDEFGNLRSYLSSYFTYVGNIMARRGLVAADETGDYGFSTVKLRQGLRPLPPVGIDSLDLTLPDLNFVIYAN